jgi:DNA-binding NarL/FixJ family response regulator
MHSFYNQYQGKRRVAMAMDIKGISGNAVSPQPQNAALTPAASGGTATPADSTPAATQPKHDTVELTGAALAKSLKLSGMNPAQIALKMGLNVKTVDSYLSIKETQTATPTPQAAPVPTTGQKATETKK